MDPADTSGELARFLELPGIVYEGDPHYSATPRASVLRSLLRPAFAGCQRVLLAERAGAPAARVVARLSPSLRDEHGRPLGLLGFFEAREDGPHGEDLLRDAIAWLRGQGAGEILGPLDGDTWHRYRFNVGPYAERPFLMEPYNKPYYPQLWERVGFTPLETYHSRRVEEIAPVAAELEPEHERALAAGYRLRPLDRARLDQELALLHDLSLRCFASNYLYTEISREEFLGLYEDLGPLLDERLVWFAHAPEGQAVAFVFALADLFRGTADAVNVKTLGVVPEHRRARLAYALTSRVYHRALALGLRRANLCLIRDGNPSSRLDAGRGTVLRRYTLYRLASDPQDDP